ncbi:hypothetical protein C0039_04415 [Pseudohalioglobus lutimaris]|uniref:DUF3604 domain-containing protein n=1 Tax=Pseudohalioglobus lutimaris TaxID=1737061 RepID=A0A2N5X7I5_9GAMM|nr:hypothetical protein C0039_04415 [Pseudohalioglobus lutimaris]
MNKVIRVPAFLLLPAGLLLSACGGVEPPAESAYAAREFAPAIARAPCKRNEETRQALFGDLHIHTSLSNDAWNFDVRVQPDDAYAYAFGEPILLPLGDDYRARRAQIDRPLDFAGVTDHAEFFGEQAVCQDPDAAGYASSFCEVMRSGEGRAPQLVMQIMSPFSKRKQSVCGDAGADCAVRTGNTWRHMIEAAQRWNDTSDNCERTTFIAYEYSSFRLGSNLHRNVIFRNTAVLQRPVSYLDVHREWDLWRILKEQCIDGDTGCDVLAIPHNSNISNGRMFAVDYPGASSVTEQAARARLRQQIEPVVEIMQHKGDSECRNGLQGVLGAEDELCRFERFEELAFSRFVGEGEEVGQCYDGPLADWLPHLGPNCLDRKNYARYALVEGLREQKRLGVNPFKFGLSASTDTHNGTGGGVQEADFPGHLGNGDSMPQQRVSFSPDNAGNAYNNPGGLIGVWAEENSRDSIFDALQRREVFGTSGPRIRPRFFGAWQLDAALCEGPDGTARAYAQAVPMGGDLPARAGDAPVFLVAATADAGSDRFPGTPLQRLQVIKGWADEEGNHHQRVYDVAGEANNGADVDPQTCAPRGDGFGQLCAVWRDPEFDAGVASVYYLRAVENPSCRYTAHQCLQLPAAERPGDCEQPLMDPVIQERAWSSPIWYTPDVSG